MALAARGCLVSRSKAAVGSSGLALVQRGDRRFRFCFSSGSVAITEAAAVSRKKTKAKATAAAVSWEVNATAHSEAISKTWAGFQSWRAGPLREDFYWESNEEGASRRQIEAAKVVSSLPEGSTLSEFGKEVLETADPLTKALLTHEAYRRFYDKAKAKVEVPVGSAVEARRQVPEKPEIVSARDCPSPKKSGLPLSAYMLHNLAHIELNAIDLAWDTVLCFAESKTPSLPADFYLDFLRVADDESRYDKNQ